MAATTVRRVPNDSWEMAKENKCPLLSCCPFASPLMLSRDRGHQQWSSLVVLCFALQDRLAPSSLACAYPLMVLIIKTFSLFCKFYFSSNIQNNFIFILRVPPTLTYLQNLSIDHLYKLVTPSNFCTFIWDVFLYIKLATTAIFLLVFFASLPSYLLPS